MVTINDSTYPAHTTVQLVTIPVGAIVRIGSVYYIRGASTSSTQAWMYNLSDNTAAQVDQTILVELVGNDPINIHAPS